MILRYSRYLFVLLVLILVGACKNNDSDSAVPPGLIVSDIKVLFIGNSFTFYNNGIDFHLQKMLEADQFNDTAVYSIQRIAESSFTLQAHYQNAATLQKIKSDKWNVVVLQEQSTRPINNPALFLQFAQNLDQEVNKINAKTALFMTWAPKDSPTDIRTISSSYINVGSELGAKVVPVGNVWDAFVKANPNINLYHPDGKHPSLAGTYLVSCCFYFALFDKNPITSTYLPAGLSTQYAISIRYAVYNYLQTY